MLRGFLDYLRASIAAKVEDAPEPAVRTSQVASGTTLLGLVNHLTHVERAVFLGTPPRDWQATFTVDDADDAHTVVTRYRHAIEEANLLLDDAPDLSAPLPRTAASRAAPSVRWALAHMIEETGRHAGHADIFRELIDGTTGR